MSTTYILVALGSVVMPQALVDIHGRDDASALVLAKNASARMARAYNLFQLFRREDGKDTSIGYWRVDLEPVITDIKER